jgi:hypothetical protein
MAWIIWSLIFKYYEEQWRKGVYHVIPILVIIIYIFNYIKLKKHIQSIVNILVFDELERAPLKMSLSSDDLDC